ncbi:hypothetical protein AM1BK_20060 [Neobacillus kokaensis]|uniref:Uncharacterized protein n=1 Tax=Neobacillus kokaensis TaxID=2759023 RepID=A0ABQ3N4M7_9BACI|nr:hypothetical protein AM1BK_20060 [Neobacillus kokaensis]
MRKKKCGNLFIKKLKHFLEIINEKKAMGIIIMSIRFFPEIKKENRPNEKNICKWNTIRIPNKVEWRSNYD